MTLFKHYQHIWPFSVIPENVIRGNVTLTVKLCNFLVPQMLMCFALLSIIESMFICSYCIPKIYPAAFQHELKSHFEYFSFYLLTSE